jgi:Fic family protein
VTYIPFTDHPLLSKIDERQPLIVAKRPLRTEEINQLKAYYRIGLTYTSNAIEGNSLSESETKVVLEDGITIGGKPLRDHLEALGHQDAFNTLYDWVDHPLSEEIIRECHRLFYLRIDEENAGQYRTQKVFVSGAHIRFPSPSEVPPLMAQLIQDWHGLGHDLHPVLKSAWLHYRLVEIHPFIDGNGRTARLLMNLILIQNGYPIAIIPPVNRSRYIDALQECSQGKYVAFYELILEMVVDSQKDFLKLVS